MITGSQQLLVAQARGHHVDRTDEVTLRLLLAVGATGSLTSASGERGMTQQAASSRIRQLERQIGTTLLTRSARGSTLTPNGLLVAGWATDLLAASDAFHASISALRTDAGAEFSIASSLTIAEHLLPRWLVKLREQRSQRHESTSVEMVAANSVTVVERVRGGASVLGFIESPEVPKDLESKRVASDELILVVNPEHSWARRGRAVSATDISSATLMTREPGSGTRLALETALRELPEPLSLSSSHIELPSNAAIRASVAAGSGPAVLSVLAVADDLALGRLVRVRIRDLTIIRPLTAVWVRGTVLPAAALELLGVAESI
jgi:DNA-binding transcriptional LysR family regulator